MSLLKNGTKLIQCQRLAIRIAHLAITLKDLHLAFSFDKPFPIQFSDQRSVIINANHVLVFLKLTLQAKNNWLPNPWNCVKVRNDKSSWHDPKSFLRSCQTKAWHPLGKDHGTG